MQTKLRKLNIGTLHTTPGWEHADMRPNPGIDYVCDVMHLDTAVPQKTFDVVRFSHTLEHVPYEDTDAALKQVFNVMKPGGLLEIAVPDLQAQCLAFFTAPEIMKPYIMQWIYGCHDFKENWHCNGFWEARLRACLEKAGFVDINRVERLPSTDIDDCSKMRTSLNMTAVAGDGPKETLVDPSAVYIRQVILF